MRPFILSAESAKKNNGSENNILPPIARIIAMSKEKHDDAWELGTGVNYSLNELYEMFHETFDVERTYIPDQKGNYRETDKPKPIFEYFL